MLYYHCRAFVSCVSYAGSVMLEGGSDDHVAMVVGAVLVAVAVLCRKLRDLVLSRSVWLVTRRNYLGLLVEQPWNHLVRKFLIRNYFIMNCS